jgi:hypothetical protein
MHQSLVLEGSDRSDLLFSRIFCCSKDSSAPYVNHATGLFWASSINTQTPKIERGQVLPPLLRLCVTLIWY